MSGEVLGIDVGGSSVKAGLVDVQQGKVIGTLISAPTPRPCTPASLIPVLVALAGRLGGDRGRIGVAFPSVIKGGTAFTAANIDHSWIGANGASLAAEALGRPVLMLNDADAAGLAEMRFGSGRDCSGTVIMLTFGTGIGTALFTGGQLFANTELGHLELRGMDAEKWASAQTRTVAGLDFPGWIARVNEYLAALHALLWPDVFILGGAVSEHFDEFAPLLRSAAEIRPARFAGHAGTVGAALAAAQDLAP
ncbi:MAG: ROK family protein [Gammaproteobacteria bacterium]|nr:ROK family protein [Gammaproteobacteria bacterium]MBV8402648.1 ROK family protein [Gammaproteobacteria bacterium]